MKGLILHCKNFSFKDLQRSIKPLGISQVVNGQKFEEGEFKNQVVILSCMEKGDTEKEIDLAVEHVVHMINQWHGGNKNVVVLPFGHLSKDLADPKKAKELIVLLGDRLRKNGYKVEMITFGTHKEVMYDVYGYPRATSWFQF